VLRSQDLTKQKQFQKGLQQLEEEGVMQVFYSPDHVRREPVLAAVLEPRPRADKIFPKILI
jgi:peptide chain release factor 3